jgi:thioredoxin reductase (NADPH)
MQTTNAKLIIIGSGPAGCSAAIYAARAGLNPILIAGKTSGGQLTTTTDVENYPGFSSILGPKLMEKMLSQAKQFGTIIQYADINEVNFSVRPFLLVDHEQNKYFAESIIISTGASAKWLGLESETKFRGFGVSACAICDGFFFKNKHVVVVGGGNSAVEEALFLTKHAAKITLIHRKNTLRAEKILQDKLFNNPKIEVLWNSQIVNINGIEGENKYVTSVDIINNGSTKNLKVEGVFIAIGHTPNTQIFSKYITCDKEGYIITNPDSTKTNIDGVFAAGDVQDKVFRQAVTAAGTGCMSALEATIFLSNL